MEKATIVPQLFEIECSPEKRQTQTAQYQTLKLKCLVNKETGVTSCKYVSCAWSKCSTFSKTVVLKLPSKKRGNNVYNPCVLWNYETGEIFSKNGADEFVKISIEEHETHYRSFTTVYDSIITCNTITGEEVQRIIFKQEKEIAVPFVAETGKLIWKIESVDYEKPKTNLTFYEDVKLTSVNGVDLWMVKYHKTEDWWLLYKNNKVASSKTGEFVKKGFCIFGQIEGDRYRFYRLQKGIDSKEVTLELTEKAIILDKEKEIPLAKTRFYREAVTGLTTDRNFFKIKDKGYPVLSPENQGDIYEKIELYVGDEDFVPARSYRDWVQYNYPKGTIAGFNVKKNVLVHKKTKLYYALLQDLDTDVEIVIISDNKIFNEGETVYLGVIKNLCVDIVKEKISTLLSHKAVIEPGYLAEVSEEQYRAFKQSLKANEENGTSIASLDKPEPQQSAKEPEPTLLETKTLELEAYVKYLLHDVDGEVRLNVQKDADGNVKVSIL